MTLLNCISLGDCSSSSYRLALFHFPVPSLISAVRDARRQGVKVVSLDWLEDSLLSSSRRPKREKEYEVERLSHCAGRLANPP
jgi:hypothetical protein